MYYDGSMMNAEYCKHVYSEKLYGLTIAYCQPFKIPLRRRAVSSLRDRTLAHYLSCSGVGLAFELSS